MNSSPPTRRNLPEKVIFPSSGIAVFESHHSKSFNMEMDSWPFHKICLVAVGEGALESPASRSRLRMHDLIWLPKGREHRFVDRPENPMTLVVACWNAKTESQNDILSGVTHGLLENFPSMRPVHLSNSYQRNLARGILKKLLRERTGHTSSGSDAASLSALLDLVVNLLRFQQNPDFNKERSKHEHDLDGVLEYLEINFDQSVQVQDLADLCDLSVRRFGTLFKERTGKTPIQYLTDTRIAYAKERLRQTENILYAAFEAGFSDIPYFYRVFKRHTGTTPGKFLEGLGAQE